MNIEQLCLAVQRFKKHDLSAFVNHDRRDILGAVTGYLIGMHTQLPTSPVTELVNYYVSSHEPATMRILDQVNNAEFINTRIACEVARNVYLLRYNIVYDPSVMIGLSAELFSGKVAALPSAVNAIFAKVGVEQLAKINEYYF